MSKTLEVIPLSFLAYRFDNWLGLRVGGWTEEFKAQEWPGVTRDHKHYGVTLELLWWEIEIVWSPCDWRKEKP